MKFSRSMCPERLGLHTWALVAIFLLLSSSIYAALWFRAELTIEGTFILGPKSSILVPLVLVGKSPKSRIWVDSTHADNLRDYASVYWPNEAETTPTRKFRARFKGDLDKPNGKLDEYDQVLYVSHIVELEPLP